LIIHRRIIDMQTPTKVGKLRQFVGGGDTVVDSHHHPQGHSHLVVPHGYLPVKNLTRYSHSIPFWTGGLMRTWIATVVALLAGIQHLQAQETASACQPDPTAKNKVIMKPLNTPVLYPPRSVQEDVTAGAGRKPLNLDIHVLQDGSIGEVTVIDSSGLWSLDQFFVEKIKETWRWEPPLSRETCLPIDTHSKFGFRYGGPLLKPDAKPSN
jgi:hypothetical protein